MIERRIVVWVQTIICYWYITITWYRYWRCTLIQIRWIAVKIEWWIIWIEWWIVWIEWWISVWIKWRIIWIETCIYYCRRTITIARNCDWWLSYLLFVKKIYYIKIYGKSLYRKKKFLPKMLDTQNDIINIKELILFSFNFF